MKLKKLAPEKWVWLQNQWYLPEQESLLESWDRLLLEVMTSVRL